MGEGRKFRAGASKLDSAKHLQGVCGDPCSATSLTVLSNEARGWKSRTLALVSLHNHLCFQKQSEHEVK